LKTNRDLEILSSLACSPRYSLRVPKGAAVIAVPTNAGLKTPTGYALDRPQDYGCSSHDAKHYFFWVPADAVDTGEGA
jgi:hypothetical protein